MRVGGRAEWLLEPATPEELRAAWLAARERGWTPRVLGGGANLIVADGLLPGVVISTARLRRTFRPLPPGEAGGQDEYEDAVPRLHLLERDEDPRLVAWAGASLPGLVRTASELGWSGLEGLAGVPGSLGGGLAMNAGTADGWLWHRVGLVRVLTPEGEFRDLARADCDPGYRRGGLGGAVATGAVLELTVDRPADVQERVRELLARKCRVQPVTQRSAGCIFVNPDPELSEGRSAGQLIDACGLKGLTRGGAEVSSLHANFIVNRGSATGADVLGLIEEVRARVADQTGIELRQEAQVWRADPAGD